MDPEIFITCSSKDQKVSRTICAALENRGLTCWISSRDVKPGQNFQEQIVKAIRAAKIMVLVFTSNANNSNEIKKELALASQNNLVVIPVRIEDVTPNEAFAYEFATRQWIDLFDDWENSIARLVELIAAALNEHPSDDRAKAGSGLTRAAAAPSFGKIVKPRPRPRTNEAIPRQLEKSVKRSLQRMWRGSCRLPSRRHALLCSSSRHSPI
jgi:TIR domain